MEIESKTSRDLELDYLAQLASSHAIDIAEAEGSGLKTVFPKANELFIDIDDDDAYNRFNEVVQILTRYTYVHDINTTPSKSGLPRRHVVVTLNGDVSDLERIALQAALGSDGKREMLSYMRLKGGDPHPTLFFEPTETYQKKAPTITDDEWNAAVGWIDERKVA